MGNPCVPIDLVCEYLTNPIGVCEVKPRLSWKISDDRPGAKQSAYQIQAAQSISALDSKPDLWKSAWVKGDRCLDIVWSGKSLTSKMSVYWRVRVKDSKGKESPWSKVSSFEMGLLKQTDWSANWITDAVGRPGPSPVFRKAFALNAKPVKARLYITSCGLFEASLNGEKVGKDYFTPGWTEYSKKVHALTYDVTNQLIEGDNAIGIILGDGWYSGYMGWATTRNIWGDKLSLIAYLEVEQADGTIEKIETGNDWRFAYGAIRDSDIYNGETVDLRMALHGFDKGGYDDSCWANAIVTEALPAKILGKPGRPIKKHEELPALVLTEPQFGVHVFDLGQNMAGIVSVRICGHQPGDTVVIRYAEMLQDDGMLYTENLRNAKCTDTLICNDWGEIVFEPKFTYHGFRYVELTGLRRKPDLGDVVGLVLHSEMPATGSFACSDPLVNQLQHNILWGQKGNFFESPTDCPQRDERLGWTGDAQIFIGTAAFNCDVSSFFDKWCEDMEDAQFKDGRIPHVAPNPFRDDKGNSAGGGGQAAWADAVVICPWMIYQCYGDTRILENRYESMKKFIDWRIETAVNFIHSEAQFGDWLAIDIPEGSWSGSPTPKDLIATAYMAKTTDLFARIASLLGKKADAKKYSGLLKKMKAAFCNEFVSPSGRITGDTQTSYLLALGFDLLPVSIRDAAANNLVKIIKNKNNHLATGFVGTPLLAPVLTSIGRVDLAYQLLLNQGYPSWLYPIINGATTMWERWNSYTKDKGFGNASMNSFNHYAYGAIGEWMVSTVAGLGIDSEKPGYKNILIKPQFGKGLTWASAELITRYGKASSAWRIEDGELTVTFEVPANTSARLELLGKSPKTYLSGRHEVKMPYLEDTSSEVKKLKANAMLKEKPKAKPKAKTKAKSKVVAKEKVQSKPKASSKPQTKAKKVVKPKPKVKTKTKAKKS